MADGQEWHNMLVAGLNNLPTLQVCLSVWPCVCVCIFIWFQSFGTYPHWWPTLTGLPSQSFLERLRPSCGSNGFCCSTISSFLDLTCFLVNWHRFIYGYVSMAGKHPIVPACVFFFFFHGNSFAHHQTCNQASKQGRKEANNQASKQASSSMLVKKAAFFMTLPATV